MVHKPTYCCNCGDKVDRVEWHIWNSRRFCELCETEFQFDEWWPRAAVFVILIFGFTGIGFHFGGSDKEPPVRTRILASPQNRGSENVVKEDDTGIPAGRMRDPGSEVPSGPPVPTVPKVELKPAVPDREPGAGDTPQEISYCGALTKKGTPCARRVKNGGRCWQHKNNPSE